MIYKLQGAEKYENDLLLLLLIMLEVSDFMLIRLQTAKKLKCCETKLITATS